LATIEDFESIAQKINLTINNNIFAAVVGPEGLGLPQMQTVDMARPVTHVSSY